MTHSQRMHVFRAWLTASACSLAVKAGLEYETWKLVASLEGGRFYAVGRDAKGRERAIPFPRKIVALMPEWGRWLRGADPVEDSELTPKQIEALRQAQAADLAFYADYWAKLRR